MRLRSIAVTVSAIALGFALAACQPKLNENNPDGEDPAINGGELTDEALAHSVDPPTDETAEGDLMGTGPDVAILPAFSVQAGDGKTRLSFAADTEAYTVDGAIDPAIAAFDPVLADQFSRTIAQESSNFAAMGTSAKAEADALKAKGEESWFPAPYGLETNFSAAGQAGNMISIYGWQYMYTGGAHGNYVLSGSTFQKGADVPEGIDAFVADKAALKALVVEGVVAEKIKRGYEESERAMVEGTANDALAGDFEWAENFVLNASTQAGKFGGMTVLFSPYDIGSYAEGAYEITIPAAKLNPILKADRASLFGGEPKPLPQMAREE
jgi:hypothetical protein